MGSLCRSRGDSLQVIYNFDMTLSRFACNGNKTSEQSWNELKRLPHRYYPVENYPHWTIIKKLLPMEGMFFNTRYQNNIPLFIFSAGIGDILEEIIQQMSVPPHHPQWIQGPAHMHTQQNSSICENSWYFQQLQSKTNILRLRDSMGDLIMADGVPGLESILKIGFLNDRGGRVVGVQHRLL
ncbi:unnamed protein product [Nyctereutes procyonoides]|uniref:(raccoon dog) hypothetical protein n=1 Tax=Nyctereutes procyonoides TaxID=34880 RepID=A0A811ZQH5_NYCPR|nr:unnamed protein product [Nyctereutes procyonoides]